MKAVISRSAAAPALAVLLLLAPAPGIMAQQPPATLEPQSPLKPNEIKPYDEKLLRLSEILGAVHYLRELCGQNDRQLWRERMREILQADSASARRRAMLSRAFNKGYRSYSRTYQSCTPTAQTAIALFLNEGSQIADGLAKSVH